MNIRLIGAILVIVACSGIGFYMAASLRTEIKNLRDLVKIMSFMECELNFRLTPLVKLSKQCADQGSSLRTVFHSFAEELENQISPDPSRCMDAALLRSNGLSDCVVTYLHELGNSFGKFDLQGQISEIRMVHQRCANSLEALEICKDTRVRNCQTIGFCVGLLMTILLL